MKNEIIFDLETNGLIYDVDTIWCATFHSSGTTISFINGETNTDLPFIYPISKLASFLKQRLDNSTFICHNLIKYDRPVLKELLGIEIPLENCQDTLLWSQLLWPDIPKPKESFSKHGLESWGLRFGIPKPKHEDWSQYSDEMLHRNREDVRINVKLWEKIKGKIK